MIEFKDVSLYHGSTPVLRNVSLRIHPGERIGIIGPNGAGKSTLFQLITGELTSTEGTVAMSGSPRIGHVRQRPEARTAGETLLEYSRRVSKEFVALESRLARLAGAVSDSTQSPAKTAAKLRELGELQSEYEHLGGYAMEARVKASLLGLGFGMEALDRPFDELSGGWKMRAELARVISGAPDLLLLDEPSNYLDLPAVEWLRRFLREYRGTMLLISHDRYLLRSLTTRTLDVDACAVTRYPGGLDWTLEERRRRRTAAMAAWANVERRRERIQQFVDRFRAKSTKASQVQSRIKELERLPEIVPPRGGTNAGGLRLPPAPRCSDPVLACESLCFGYERERPLFEDFSLQLLRKDRLVIIGYNGLGKTTLLRLMAGRLTPWSGKVTPGHNVRIGYLSQDTAETLPPALTVLECARAASLPASENALRTLLGGYGFSGEDVAKPCGVLSGGEKIRLAFACLAGARPNLLLLDEPTTHLDIDGRLALDRALKAYEGAVCFVSHDIDFVRSLATAVVHLSSSGIRRFPGGYDDFMARYAVVGGEESEEESRRGEREGGGKSARERRRARARERARSVSGVRALRDRVQACEREIIEMEEEQERLASGMHEAASRDHAADNRRLAEISRRLAEVNRRWEEAGRRLEEAEGPTADPVPRGGPP